MLKNVPMLLTTLIIAVGGTCLSLPAHGRDLPGAGTEEDRQLPEQVGCEHWAYREIAALVQKYGAEKKPTASLPCSRAELADCLVGVMEKIVQAYRKEGNKQLVREDLQRVTALQAALERELTENDGYRTLRGSIQEILTVVESEVPPFIYMVGVNGFLRGEASGNYTLPDLSFAPGRNEARFLYRVKPYGYWHPTDYLDLHLEGQMYGYDGESHAFARGSLYQGFVEARIPGQDLLALKAGRQEFVYGSAFIFGADSAFDGLTFDAARLRVRPTDTLTVDVWGGRYATPFSDGTKGNLAAAYLTYTPGKDCALEAYLVRDAGSGDHHPGERLDIIGLRSTGKFGPLSLEFEPVYESGRDRKSVV